MHLKTSERANEEFPLEPYIQTPDKGFMTSGIEAGTLVIPVNPKQVGIPWLRGMSAQGSWSMSELMCRSLQTGNDTFYAGSIPLDTARDSIEGDQIPAQCHS
jgi:hypothetical protein